MSFADKGWTLPPCLPPTDKSSQTDCNYLLQWTELHANVFVFCLLHTEDHLKGVLQILLIVSTLCVSCAPRSVCCSVQRGYTILWQELCPDCAVRAVCLSTADSIVWVPADNICPPTLWFTGLQAANHLLNNPGILIFTLLVLHSSLLGLSCPFSDIDTTIFRLPVRNICGLVHLLKLDATIRSTATRISSCPGLRRHLKKIII